MCSLMWVLNEQWIKKIEDGLRFKNMKYKCNILKDFLLMYGKMPKFNLGGSNSFILNWIVLIIEIIILILILFFNFFLGLSSARNCFNIAWVSKNI